MNYYEHVKVNKSGYQVTSRVGGTIRTYACSDRAGLDALILHLTNRSVTTFTQNANGLPQIENIWIQYPFHIYGS